MKRETPMNPWPLLTHAAAALSLLLTTACAPDPTLPLEGGAATLVYEYSLESEDGIYATHVSERLPVYFFVDPAAPRAGTVLAGGQTGMERMRVDGLDGDKPCRLELTYTVRFDITGSFDPADGCRLSIYVTTIPDPAQVTAGGSCPLDLVADFQPELFFIPPHPGPFEFVAPYAPIAFAPGPGASVRVSLEDVQLPFATGCP